jgi:hypothetical protein
MGRQKKLMSIPAKCRRLALPRSSGQRVTVTRLVAASECCCQLQSNGMIERVGMTMHQLPF